ncbi:MAG: 50S ribosomal protein L32 [Chloroflexi bacterium]|nr:50S ribosomal protein L32 [Chloroflexota bacterium]
MAAVPKKKLSKGRKGKRAAHHSLRAVSLAECAQCHSAKQQHRVCPPSTQEPCSRKLPADAAGWVYPAAATKNPSRSSS